MEMGTCSFCQEEAHGACSWPTEAFVVAEVHELKEGDIVRRFKEVERAKLKEAEVHRVSRLGKDGLYRLELFIVTLGGNYTGRKKVFETNEFARMRVKRQMPCGLPVCSNHLAARAPKVYVCASHWSAWSDIA